MTEPERIECANNTTIHERHLRLSSCILVILDESNLQSKLNFWRKSNKVSPINSMMEKLHNLYNYYSIRKQSQKQFIFSFGSHIVISKALCHISKSLIFPLTQISHFSGCGLTWSSHGSFSCNYNNVKEVLPTHVHSSLHVPPQIIWFHILGCLFTLSCRTQRLRETCTKLVRPAYPKILYLQTRRSTIRHTKARKLSQCHITRHKLTWVITQVTKTT